jgi:hypothetical protein
MINQLWGAVTFSPSVALSAIFSQGQTAYPGTAGAGPTGQAATTTTTAPASGATAGLADCLTCALDAFKSAGYVRVGTGLTTKLGKVLSLKVAVGPTALDQASAALVIARWQDLGIKITQVDVTSEPAAASAAASDKVDVAIFTRTTLTTPSYTARSWAGPAYVDSYPSGVRSSTLTGLYNTAVANFNPVGANATWLSMDQVIMNEFWVRPLYTAPSLVEWTSTLANVVGSLSATGFVDQVPSWTIAPASSQT